MAKQLIYTSARKGIRPESSGYCTVLSTKGITRAEEEFLESLSVFAIADHSGEEVIPTTPENYDQLLSMNPPNIANVKFQYRNQSQSVLLKTCLAGFDYSHRLRKLSHFFLVDQAEKKVSDPAWLIAKGAIFQGDWDSEPVVLQEDTILAGEVEQIGECRAWERFAGDAGWAGCLVNALHAPNRPPVYVIYEPTVSAVPLLQEALRLLPTLHRWNATFSTNFASMSSAVDCQWRFVPKSSPEIDRIRANKDCVRIDLTEPLGAPPNTPEVQAARQGQTIEPSNRFSSGVITVERSGRRRKASKAKSDQAASNRKTSSGRKPKSNKSVRNDSKFTKRFKLMIATLAAAVLLVIVLLFIQMLGGDDSKKTPQPSIPSPEPTPPKLAPNVAPEVVPDATPTTAPNQEPKENPESSVTTKTAPSLSPALASLSRVKPNSPEKIISSPQRPVQNYPADSLGLFRGLEDKSTADFATRVIPNTSYVEHVPFARDLKFEIASPIRQQQSTYKIQRVGQDEWIAAGGDGPQLPLLVIKLKGDSVETRQRSAFPDAEFKSTVFVTASSNKGTVVFQTHEPGVDSLRLAQANELVAKALQAGEKNELAGENKDLDAELFKQLSTRCVPTWVPSEAGHRWTLRIELPQSTNGDGEWEEVDFHNTAIENWITKTNVDSPKKDSAKEADSETEDDSETDDDSTEGDNTKEVGDSAIDVSESFIPTIQAWVAQLRVTYDDSRRWQMVVKELKEK